MVMWSSEGDSKLPKTYLSTVIKKKQQDEEKREEREIAIAKKTGNVTIEI